MSAPPIPREAVLVSRAYFMLAALAAAVAALAGLAMQAELWSPALGPGGVQAYAQTLRAHAALLSPALVAPALAGMFGYALAAEATGAPRLRARGLAALGALGWLAALIAATTGALQDQAWVFAGASGTSPAQLAAAAAALGGLACALHLGGLLAAGRRTAAPLLLATGAVFAAAVAGACAATLTDAVRTWSLPGAPPAHDDLAAGCTWIAAAALATFALLRAPVRPAASTAPAPAAAVPYDPVVTAAALAGLAGAIAWGLGLPGAAGLLTIAAWITCLARGGRWRLPAVTAIALGLVPALLALVIARPLLAHSDLHLHDTYAAVGQWHLWAAAVGFAALAGLLSWAPALLGRAPRAWLAHLGIACCSAGALTHALAELVLGTRGMPRRYAAYTPELTAGHRAATVGAALAVLGLALVLVACARGPRATARS